MLTKKFRTSEEKVKPKTGKENLRNLEIILHNFVEKSYENPQKNQETLKMQRNAT